jgi:hypothetical protein
MESSELTDEDLSSFSFTVQSDSGEELELCPGGKDLKLNLKNRGQYGNLLARFYL